MNIAIIGAAGKVGTLLTAEAIKQQYHVTAIVRHAENLSNRGLKVIEKSIFDLTVDDLKPFEVVINAYKAPEGEEEDYVRSTAHLISLFQSLPRTRLIVVGGAGSLYVDEAKTTRLVETVDFPEAYKPTAINMGKAFDLLQSSTILWSYFSPAAFFDFEGAATGKYILGKDHFMTNKAGDSYISYADYSIALIDEIKNKAFIQQRFTAVSNLR